MAAVAGKMAFMEPFDINGTLQIPQIGTFNGHPVAAAAGLAMMKTLLADGGMAAAMRHGEQLKDGIAVRVLCQDICKQYHLWLITCFTHSVFCKLLACLTK